MFPLFLLSPPSYNTVSLSLFYFFSSFLSSSVPNFCQVLRSLMPATISEHTSTTLRAWLNPKALWDSPALTRKALMLWVFRSAKSVNVPSVSHQVCFVVILIPNLHNMTSVAWIRHFTNLNIFFSRCMFQIFFSNWVSWPESVVVAMTGSGRTVWILRNIASVLSFPPSLA